MLESLESILADDGYRRLHGGEEPIPGDLVIYVSDGIREHIGIILEVRKLGTTVIPQVLSKWGPGPEYIHSATRTPYGTNIEYWTERP